MKKRFRIFTLFLLAVFCLTSFAFAADPGAGRIEIENSAYANSSFSCDVKLSEHAPEGNVFAVLLAESGKVKRIAKYPANNAAVKVSLSDVASTDCVNILWTDKNNMPLTDAVPQLMPARAYADFEARLNKNAKMRADSVSASADPNRLLASCEKPLNWSAYGLSADAVIPGPNQLYVLQYNTHSEAKKYKLELESNPLVRYVEFDSVMTWDKDEEGDAARTLSGEPPLSWGAQETGLNEYAAWLLEKGLNREIVVAVVDSGVDPNHSFFGNRLLPGHSTIPGNPDPKDEYEHGTHVAGIIADCTPGMNVRILPVRVLDRSGLTSSLTIANGIDYAANHGADIINLSLGYHEHKQVIDEAIQRALAQNITVVVAACNYNEPAEEYCPAHIEGCITVAAVERQQSGLRRWDRSNHGEVVDISAPGGKVYSAIPNNRYDTMSGTSMAAPHAAAAAALLMCERGTAQTPAQICDALKNAAAPFNSSGKKMGAGVLNMRPFITRTVQVQLKFDPNGGTGSMNTLTVSPGTVVTLDENGFSNAGKSFNGWNTKADGSGASYQAGASFTVNDNVTLYAQWTTDNGVYALLYSDGELIFQNGSAPDAGKTLVKSYLAPMTENVAQYVAWYENRSMVRKVVFSSRIRPTFTASWFYGCANLSEVEGLENLDTSQVKNMSQMFYGCSALQTLDLSAWNTDSVTNMNSMFFDCGALTELNLTGWDTASVTDMRDMFKDCASLNTVRASESFSTGTRTPFDFTANISADTTLYAGWTRGAPDETSNSLVVSSASAGPGDIIPVTIAKRGSAGAISLGFDVVFPDELTLTTKPIVGALFEDMGLHREVFTSPYTISLGSDTSAKNVTAEGVLVTLYFQVDSDAAPGKYEITIINQDNNDANLDGVTFDVVSGSVTVTSASLFSSADGSLVVDNATVEQGDTDTIIPIAISKTGPLGAITLGFQVTFPDELILVEKPAVWNLFADANMHLDLFTSPYAIALGSDTTAEDITAEGAIVTLYFKVREGAAPGRYEITIQNQDNTNAALDPVEFDVTAGGITVTPGNGGSALAVGGGTVAQGDTDTIIPITIDKRGSTGAISLNFQVAFPDELILVEKPVVGNLFADMGLHLDTLTSPYAIALGNDTAAADTTAEGAIVTLYFKVRDGAAPGRYEITILNQDNTNADLDGVEFPVVPGAVTVTPRDTQTVSVTFDGNGGTPEKTTVSVSRGSRVNPPSPNPTREGYAFNGWYTYRSSKTLASDGMFSGCTSIAGGSGTGYHDAHTDGEYARIDGGASAPGYFKRG